MGKFMDAKFNSVCGQTGKSIKKGDSVYYIPGRGAFHDSSAIYQDNRENSETAGHVKAQEEAYFDNFCQKNNI